MQISLITKNSYDLRKSVFKFYDAQKRDKKIDFKIFKVIIYFHPPYFFRFGLFLRLFIPPTRVSVKNFNNGRRLMQKQRNYFFKMSKNKCC